MSITAFALASLGIAFVIFGLLLSITQFAVWLAASRDREHAFYALVTGAALAGCAQSGISSDRFSNGFFDKAADPSHSEWLSRVKADRL